jgi:hypothetical protein
MFLVSEARGSRCRHDRQVSNELVVDQCFAFPEFLRKGPRSLQRRGSKFQPSRGVLLTNASLLPVVFGRAGADGSLVRCDGS